MNPIPLFLGLLMAVLFLVAPILAIVAFVRTRALREDMDHLREEMWHVWERLNRPTEPASRAAASPTFVHETPPASVSSEPAEEPAPMERPRAPSLPKPTPEGTVAAVLASTPISRPASTPKVPASPVVDWEQFTGAKLFAWVGGLALALGALFFVKYSIDHGWISPALRVASMMVLGLGAILLGLSLRGRGTPVTVETLCAAGVAILYGDAFAAHARYALIGSAATGGFLVLVTVVGFLLAARLKSRVIAVLGLLGGFLVPPLLSTGVDRPFGLFSYITMLNVGVAAVIHKMVRETDEEARGGWAALWWLALGGTLLMEVAWVGKFFNVDKALIGAAIFLWFPLLFAAVGALTRSDEPGGHWGDGPAATQNLASILFGAYLLNFASLAARPGLTLTFLFLVDALFTLQALRRRLFQMPQLLGGALVFLALSAWTSGRMTLDLLPWGLGFFLLFAVLHSAFPVLLRRRGVAHAAEAWIHAYPALLLVPVLIAVSKNHLAPVLIWPVVFGIDAAVYGVAVAVGALWIAVLAVLLTLGAGLLWVLRLSDPGGLTGLLGVMALFAVGFFFLGLRLLKKAPVEDAPVQDFESEMSREALRHLPALSALLPFVLLATAASRLSLPNPSPVFGLGALLLVLLLGLSALRRIEALPLVSLAATFLMQLSWHVRQAWSGDIGAVPHGALAWYGGTLLAFLAFPFLVRRRIEGQRGAWWAAAFAGPAYYFLLYPAWKAAIGPGVQGLLPALLAVVYLVALAQVSRDAASDEDRLRRQALMGGVALFFISAIFPAQFSKQWITLGWALEGAALVALFRRVAHPGLKLWGLGLLIAAFIRLAFNPAVLAYHPRTGMLLWNWYLGVYGTAALACLAAARWWQPTDERFVGSSPRALLASLGGILLFLLLNIEIADAFSAGATLTFNLRGNLAQDMAYTLGWGAFGLGLLTLSLHRRMVFAKRAAMALLAVTCAKLFIHDIWRLSLLYKAGAFGGFALVLLRVSYLYQRHASTEAPQ